MTKTSEIINESLPNSKQVLHKTENLLNQREVDQEINAYKDTNTESENTDTTMQTSVTYTASNGVIPEQTDTSLQQTSTISTTSIGISSEPKETQIQQTSAVPLTSAGTMPELGKTVDPQTLNPVEIDDIIEEEETEIVDIIPHSVDIENRGGDLADLEQEEQSKSVEKQNSTTPSEIVEYKTNEIELAESQTQQNVDSVHAENVATKIGSDLPKSSIKENGFVRGDILTSKTQSEPVMQNIVKDDVQSTTEVIEKTTTYSADAVHVEKLPSTGTSSPATGKVSSHVPEPISTTATDNIPNMVSTEDTSDEIQTTTDDTEAKYYPLAEPISSKYDDTSAAADVIQSIQSKLVKYDFLIYFLLQQNQFRLLNLVLHQK